MLSLERMTGRSGRGLNRPMDGVDGGLSGQWMAHRRTVALSVTVLVLKCYYSFCYKRLFWPRFQGKPPTSATGRQARFEWIDERFQSVTSVH
ncbi:hypothetical protein FIV36_22535 [Pseudomonas extremaustralis]|uniref:Uncharacterized protein n=1 Tax=Pseudomonas extremaustralis TaxID=359110 RepID=A0A5C5Q8V7_9PSED|nr:hypothetical protein FIV36_22535 [Pseudomonas extremaustralis]